MHRFLSRAAAGATFLLVPALALAQRTSESPSVGDGYHPVSIGFGGGVSVPTGDARDALENGVNGQGFVLFQLPGGLPAVRLNLGYQKFDFKEEVLGGVSGEQQLLSGVGGLSLNLLNGPVRPYVTAGVGAFQVKTSIESGSGETSESDVDFGIDGGAGVAVTFGRLSGFVEGRVQNVYTRSGGAIDVKSIRAVPVTFGILIGL